MKGWIKMSASLNACLVLPCSLYSWAQIYPPLPPSLPP